MFNNFQEYKKMKTFCTLFVFLLITINVMIATENVKIDVSYAQISSSEFDIGSPGDCFDDDISTLMRSSNINPAYVLLEFESPVSVDSAAVFVGQVGYQNIDMDVWWLEAADNINDLNGKSGTYILAVDSGSQTGGVWHGAKFTTSISKKLWKFNVKRVKGGDYVHIWELALYSFDIPVITHFKLDLMTEMKANNIVINNSANMPANEVFDKNMGTGLCFESQNSSHFLITNRTKHSINRVKLLFNKQCTWFIEYADSHSDLKSRTNSFKVTEHKQNTANKWDSANFIPDLSKKHFRIVTEDNGTNLCLNEIEFYSDTPMDNLIGLQNELELWVGWTWKNVQDFLLYKGKTKIAKNLVQWSSSEPLIASVGGTGVIKTIRPGNVTITATYMGEKCSTKVNITSSGKQMDKGIPSQFIAQPAKNNVYEVPFVIINFIPTTDGINKNAKYAMNYLDIIDRPLTEVNYSHRETVERLKFALEEGSRFRKYKNPDAVPSIGVKVVEYITIYEPIPPSIVNGLYDNGILKYAYDFNQIFQRINLKDLVENKGVRYVWILGCGANAYLPGYDADYVKPETFRAAFESYMSTPTGVQACNGSNPEPLPVYSKTYTVINSSMNMAEFNMLNFEPFTHQFESLLIKQNEIQDGNRDFLWDKFVGKIGRCGWTHTPPNTEINYGYFHYIQANPDLVQPTLADIEDWKPDNSGQKKLISYHTWEDIQYNWPDGKTQFTGREELQWFIYWLQSIPGFQNKIPYSLNGEEYYIPNWWKFFYDWDYYAKNDTGLYVKKAPHSVHIAEFPHKLCAGAEFELPFILNRDYEVNNIFKVEMSDYTGNFANSTIIGNLSSQVSGNILCKIPDDAIQSSNYKLRIISSNPEVISNVNSTSFSILRIANPDITGESSVCKFNSMDYIYNFEENMRYKWSVSGGMIQGCDTCQTVTVLWNDENSNEGKVILKAENSIFCESYDTLNVNLIPLPVPEIEGSKVLCRGQILQLSSKLNEGYDFKWKVQGGNIIGDDDSQNLIIKFNNPGKFKISLKNAAHSTGCYDSTEIEVTVINSPEKPLITKFGNKLVSSANIGNQWFLNNEVLVDSIHHTIYPSISGDYSVLAKLGDCFSDTSEIVKFIFSDVNEINYQNSELIIYNPYEKLLTVKSDDISRMLIFNLNGVLIKRYDTPVAGDKIDLSNYPVGLYFIVVNDKYMKIIVY
jgi:hypothetical protein